MEKKIVYRTKRSIGLVLATAWLVSLALANGAAAQETGAKSFEITPSRYSGVSGIATLRDVEGGVEVTVNVEGLLWGVGDYTHHIHEGATCEDDKVGRGGPVEFPLGELTASLNGTASATSVVEGTTLAQLLNGGKERFLNFHPAPPEGSVSQGVACTTLAPLASSSVLPDSGLAPLASSSVLPDSGGVQSFGLLLGTVGIVLGAVVIVIGASMARRARHSA